MTSGYICHTLWPDTRLEPPSAKPIPHYRQLRSPYATPVPPISCHYTHSPYQAFRTTLAHHRTAEPYTAQSSTPLAKSKTFLGPAGTKSRAFRSTRLDFDVERGWELEGRVVVYLEDVGSALRVEEDVEAQDLRSHGNAHNCGTYLDPV
eukprot:757146-Rhodomonas_salina.1